MARLETRFLVDNSALNDLHARAFGHPFSLVPWAAAFILDTRKIRYPAQFKTPYTGAIVARSL
jgi:hypothetical protein